MNDPLAIVTELMSRVGRVNRDLMLDRNVRIFVELFIEEGRKAARPSAPERAPLAPVDFDPN